MYDSLRPHGLQHTRLPYPSPTSQSLLKLMSIKSVMPSNHLILCRPLPPSALNLSQHWGLLQRVNSSHEVAVKYWSFNFSSSPSHEHSGLISFSIDWFDLLVVEAAQVSYDGTTSNSAAMLTEDVLWMNSLWLL